MDASTIAMLVNAGLSVVAIIVAIFKKRGVDTTTYESIIESAKQVTEKYITKQCKKHGIQCPGDCTSTTDTETKSE